MAVGEASALHQPESYDSPSPGGQYSGYYKDGFSDDFEAEDVDVGRWEGLWGWRPSPDGYNNSTSGVAANQYQTNGQNYLRHRVYTGDRIYIEAQVAHKCVVTESSTCALGFPQAGVGAKFFNGYPHSATEGAWLALSSNISRDGTWTPGTWYLSAYGSENGSDRTNPIFELSATPPPGAIDYTVNPYWWSDRDRHDWVRPWIIIDRGMITAGVVDADGKEYVLFPFVEFDVPYPFYRAEGVATSMVDDFKLDVTSYGARNGAGVHAQTEGDPVNVSSGNAHMAETDLSIGTAGPAISLVRHYNNLDRASAGPFGLGWQTSFDQRIITGVMGPKDAADPYGAEGVVWRRADGREDFFRGNPDCSPSNPAGTRVARPGVYDALVCHGGMWVATDTANVTYAFDGDDRLASVRDRSGLGYDVTRDGQGRVIDVTHALGPNLHMDYDGSGRLTTATTSDGNSVTYGYAGTSLVSVTRPGNQVQKYSYDDASRLDAITDTSGTLIFQQDLSLGRVGSQTDARGSGHTFAYRAGPVFGSGGSTIVTDQFGKTVTDTYDSHGFATARTDQEGSTTRYGYNNSGDRTSVQDSTGATWSTAYSNGEPTSVTDPNGATSTSQYRSDHQISATTDPTGVYTRYSYDSKGRLSSIDPSGPAGTSAMVTNGDGTVSASISPDGLITRTEYDARGRPVRTIDAGHRSSYTQFNPDGTVAKTTSPGGIETSTEYDPAKRPIRIDSPGGALSRFSYDAAGNQNSITDPLGNQTHFGYDLDYNLYETSATIEGGDVVKAKFGYDAANRLVSTTEPGNAGTTTMTYTPTGRIESITDADGTRWSYQYSTRSEMTGAISPDGTRSETTYDSAGRVIRSGNTRDGYSTFEYDPAGRLTRSHDPKGRETAYSYDESGRHVGSTDTTRGPEHPVTFSSTLSPGGRRESEKRTYYGVGPESSDTDETAVSYSYGTDGAFEHITSPQLIGAGEISLTTDPTTGWAYSASGPGSRVVFSYDAAGRVTDRATTLGSGPGAMTVASPTAYDASGNVTSLGTWSYTYDKLSRLVKAENSATAEVFEYQYDAASNRRQIKRNDVVVQSLSFGAANRIDTAASPEFAYDSTGRLISDTAGNGHKRHYIWDGSSRLIGIDLYLPETGHYRNLRMSYDSAGKMVQKDTYLDLTYLAERLYFHYDGTRLIGEEDMTGTVREYLYAGGEAPTAMRSRNPDGSYSNFFFVTNTHGDVVALTDRDGNVVNRYAYGPWGEATRVSEQVHQPFRYAGYRYEDGFDLYYLRARWMDPNTGRFLSRDSDRGSSYEILSLNRYAYAEGNPASGADPSGHSPARPKIGPGIKALFPSKKCASRDMEYGSWVQLAHTLSDYLIAGGVYPSLTSSNYHIESDKELAKREGAKGYWINRRVNTMKLDWGQNLCSMKRSGGLATLIHETEHVDQNDRLGDDEFDRLYRDYDRNYGYGHNPLEDEAFCKEIDILGVLAGDVDVDTQVGGFGGGGGTGFGRSCRPGILG